MNLARRRYEALLIEQRDRSLTEKELAFLARYRASHPECGHFEAKGDEAFSMLRGLAVEDEQGYSERFETRVIRRWKLNSVRDTATYWSPAICGAVIAAVALLAIFQLLGRGSTMPPLSVTGSEARRTELPKPVFPDTDKTGDASVSR